MLDFLAISLGAIVGANARCSLSRYAAKLFGPVFPYGTLIINTAGSFIVGFIVIWTTERARVGRRISSPTTCSASPRRWPEWVWQGYCKMPEAMAVQVTI